MESENRGRTGRRGWRGGSVGGESRPAAGETGGPPASCGEEGAVGHVRGSARGCDGPMSVWRKTAAAGRDLNESDSPRPARSGAERQGCPPRVHAPSLSRRWRRPSPAPARWPAPAPRALLDLVLPKEGLARAGDGPSCGAGRSLDKTTLGSEEPPLAR